MKTIILLTIMLSSLYAETKLSIWECRITTSKSTEIGMSKSLFNAKQRVQRECYTKANECFKGEDCKLIYIDTESKEIKKYQIHLKSKYNEQL